MIIDPSSLICVCVSHIQMIQWLIGQATVWCWSVDVFSNTHVISQIHSSIPHSHHGIWISMFWLILWWILDFHSDIGLVYWIINIDVTWCVEKLVDGVLLSSCLGAWTLSGWTRSEQKLFGWRLWSYGHQYVSQRVELLFWKKEAINYKKKPINYLPSLKWKLL